MRGIMRETFDGRDADTSVHLSQFWIGELTMTSIPHFVYELVDPRDDSMFYVGITIDLYERYKQHMHCNGSNAQKDSKIQEILASGHLPVMHTLDRAEALIEARIKEDYWIVTRLEQGAVLLNLFVPENADKIKRAVICDNIGRKGTMERTREVILYRLTTGQWPDDLSDDMRWYYNKHYIKRGAKYYRKVREWKEALKLASEGNVLS
jgi:predicted GIY-YIG superfamily endonuclease